MAFLRSIRLKGFKTFARPTELLFESGVTVIIGPNGSGKSNIADAVLWALGEQSPTNLRGRSMQDVIFSGSDGRKAGAVAEVALVFDNAGGAFPVDFEEVEITRRVLRDGSSEYRINGAACRLLDVQELVSSVGLGREMHSVISQGKVDELVNSTPSMRRALVEEAAGLGRYKKRRDRSRAKLERVRENLRRVAEVEREVRSALRPLKLQATAAERHAEVAEELAGMRACAALRQELDLRQAIAELEDRRREISGRRAEAEEGLARLRDERNRAEERFAAALRERERITALYHRARADVDRLQSRAAVLRQRLVRAEGEFSRAVRRRESVEGEAEAAAERLAALQVAPAHGGRRLVVVQTAAAEVSAVLGTLRPELARLMEEEDEWKDRVFELEAERSRRTQERELLKREVVERRRREVDLAAQEEAAAARADMLARELEERRRELASAESHAGAAAAAAAACAEEAARLRHEEGEARAALRRAEEELAAVASRRRVLEQVSVRREGVPPAARSLLEALEGARLVVETLRVRNGFEKAVIAALGGLAGAVVVPGEADLRIVTGSAGPLEVIWPFGDGSGELALNAGRQGAWPPGVVELWSVLGGPPEVIAALRTLLPVTVVVEDATDWAGPADVRAVTRQGQVVHGRIHAAYRDEAGAEALLAARSELEGLVAREAATREARNHAARRAESAAAAAAEAEERARRAEQELRETRRAAAGLHDEVDLFQRRLQEGIAQLAEVRARVERDREVTAGLDRDRERVEGALHEVESGLEAARVGLRAARERAEAMRMRVERFEAKRTQAALLEVRLRERRRVHEEELRRCQAVREGALDALAASRRREAAYAELCPRLAALQEVVEALAGEFGLRLAALEEEMGRVREAGATFGEAAKDQGRREAHLQQELSSLSESLVEVEVELARLRERADEKSRELAELRRRHLTPRSVSEEKAREADVETMAADIARLERRLESIGPVNPLAEQEYHATEERARFLAEQRKDLEASMAELQRLIDDLEEHIQSTFADVFEATRANFSEMVGVLFPGGKGVLRLAEDHAEDAEPAGGGEGRPSLPGIVLEIKPPKKAPRSMSLLSGGEKALAAIAFLFALFLARPCPFYLLDEVEAALDDLNLGRFLSLVRRYQGQTQFIIITHQRRTMEIAHTLYGVALDPDGTSRVLSRRLASAGGVSGEGAGDTQAGSAAGSG